MESFSFSETCNLLWGTYPRFIGPTQSQVNSFPELQSHMVAQSGIMNCFVSVYHFYPFFNPVIDKLFLESDYENKEKSLQVGKNLFEECTEKYKLSTLPLWSGNKSPHILPLLLPEVVDNPSNTIKKAAYQLCYTSSNYYIDPISKKNIPYIDTKVLEPRRLQRYPNTQRVTESGLPSGNHCIILDPDRFLDMSLKEILELSRSPQTYNIKLNPPTKKISDINTKDIDLSEWSGGASTSLSPTSSYSYTTNAPQSSTVKFLLDKLITRPCNRLGISYPNPSHIVRRSVAAELRKKGISESFSNYIFSLLNLFDYDPAITSYHIQKIYERKFYPYGYNEMKDEGICSDTFISQHGNHDCINCRKYAKKEK